MRRTLSAVLAVGLLGTAAGAVPLQPLLEAVAANARAPHPVRADVTIQRGDVRGTAVLVAWRHALYLETPAGFRALVRGAKTIVARDGRPVAAPIRTPVPGTDLLLEELPFEGAPVTFPQINDEGPDGVVVAGAPAARSLYVLIVRWIDAGRHVVTTTKYYKDDIASLFKIRTDGAFADVDGHLRPTTVEVQDFVENTTTKLGLAWRPAPELTPALFRPRALRAPSSLTAPPPTPRPAATPPAR